MESNKGKYPTKEREHPHHLLDSTVWNEFKYRDDDIVINAYSKSGTTWVQQIIAQLIWRGAENINVSEMSPWLDCRFPSKEERLKIVEAQTHRRFIKSHCGYTCVFTESEIHLYRARWARRSLEFIQPPS